MQERLQILNMIEQGTITASEGADLLKALEQSYRQKPDQPMKGASPARWLRVRVTNRLSGAEKTSVNIPIGLVRTGIEIGGKFVVESAGIHAQQIISAIQLGQQGKIVDISEPDSEERIELFIE